MKKQIIDYCSRFQTERYLLNQMTQDEETLFQEHVETCKTCKSYLNSIRKLSCVVAEEELAYVGSAAHNSFGRVQKIKLWSIVSMAACISLVAGFSLYMYNSREHGYRTSTHEVFINQQSKGDKAVIAVEMVFPDKEVVTLNFKTPLVFEWNREVAYKLTILNENNTVLEMEGFGNLCEPEFTKIEGYAVLDWVICIEEHEFKGRIYILEL